MKKYDPKVFVGELSKKLHDNNVPSCPYCHGSKFTSTDKFASILIGDDLENVSLGPSIPSGILICENCGHMEFFALGVLGLMNSKEE